MPQSLSERIQSLRHTPSWKLRKPTQNTSRLDAVNLERRWEAMELRRSGMSYTAISKKLDVGITTIREDILWCFDQVIVEPAEEVRALELERLDTMQLALWPKALNGDFLAIDRVLKIMAIRDRILGIDEPEDANINYIAKLAEEIGRQLGINPAAILDEAEFIAKRQWLGEPDDATDEAIEGEVVASEYADNTPE